MLGEVFGFHKQTVGTVADSLVRGAICVRGRIRGVKICPYNSDTDTATGLRPAFCPTSGNRTKNLTPFLLLSDLSSPSHPIAISLSPHSRRASPCHPTADLKALHSADNQRAVRRQKI